MKFLNKRELRQKTTISIQHITRLEKAGKFPKRIQLTQNRVAWLETEVEEWMQNRITDSR
jgi:prophage regulatory protein